MAKTRGDMRLWGNVSVTRSKTVIIHEFVCSWSRFNWVKLGSMPSPCKCGIINKWFPNSNNNTRTRILDRLQEYILPLYIVSFLDDLNLHQQSELHMITDLPLCKAAAPHERDIVLLDSLL